MKRGAIALSFFAAVCAPVARAYESSIVCDTEDARPKGHVTFIDLQTANPRMVWTDGYVTQLRKGADNGNLLVLRSDAEGFGNDLVYLQFSAKRIFIVLLYPPTSSTGDLEMRVVHCSMR